MALSKEQFRYIVNPGYGATHSVANMLDIDVPDPIGHEYEKRFLPKQSQYASTAGTPARPRFTNILGNDKSLPSNFQMKPRQLEGLTSNVPELDQRMGNIQLDRRALEALRTKGLSEGDSPWARMMIDKQGIEEQTARARGAAESLSQAAQARSSLASRGGLSSGANERLALQMGRTQSQRAQDIGREGLEQRLGIRTQDEGQKTQILSQLPGMEIQSLQPEFQKVNAWQQMADNEQGRDFDRQKFNIENENEAARFNVGNMLGEKRARDSSDVSAYQEQMRAWAADKQANAIEKSGKK